MPDIRFVIFDMDQVLYDYDHQVRLRLLEELTGRPATEIDAAVWGGPHEAAAEAGSPDTAEGYLAQYARLLGYPIDFDTWADIRRQMMRARPLVLAHVRRLKERADLALLTNNGMMLKAALPVCAPETIEIFGEKHTFPPNSKPGNQIRWSIVASVLNTDTSLKKAPLSKTMRQTCPVRRRLV